MVGAGDFGSPAYREGLGVLLRAMDATARIAPAARRRAFDEIARMLAGRIRAHRGWAAHPHSLAQPLARPLVIAALPRTGTSTLQQLLALDPRFQHLPYWLARMPAVRTPRGQWAADPAHALVEGEIAGIYAANPGLARIHLMSADDADECRLVLMQTFANISIGCNWQVPGYDDWLLAQDPGPAYRYYADVLRLIGAAEPGRPWLLKCPTHLLGLDRLLEAIPDACIVQTHRDPAEVVPSNCSAMLTGRHIFEHARSSRRAAGRHNLHVWGTALARAAAVADARPDRFFHVRYVDLLDDPVGIVRDLYRRFGYTLTAPVEHAMRDWIARNPQHRHGVHSYRAADFGLTEAGIRRRFAGYIGRRLGRLPA